MRFHHRWPHLSGFSSACRNFQPALFEPLFLLNFSRPTDYFSITGPCCFSDWSWCDRKIARGAKTVELLSDCAEHGSAEFKQCGTRFYPTRAASSMGRVWFFAFSSVCSCGCPFRLSWTGLRIGFVLCFLSIIGGENRSAH